MLCPAYILRLEGSEVKKVQGSRFSVHSLQMNTPITQKFHIHCCLVVAAVLLCSCATNPVTKKTEFVLMSEDQELQLGREMDPQIKEQYGVYNDSSLQAYVSSVGQRIAAVSHRPDISFHFTVLNDPMVNAFALPGGYIYITRGLLAHMNSEAELAGVLAHEAGHVTARHAVRQYTKGATYTVGKNVASIFFPELSQGLGQLADVVFVAISSGYSREFENEADNLAVTYATAAGYDPRAMASILRTLELLNKDEEESYTSLFATHPATQKRIESVEQAAGSAGSSPLVIGREVYLKHIDGILFGQDIRQGVISGSTFRHPTLRIQAVFPTGWPVANTADAVKAQEPNNYAALELRIHHPNSGTTLEAAARSISSGLGLTLFNGTLQQINGLRAYVGTYGGRTSDGQSVGARIGFFMINDTVYYILGYANSSLFSRADPYFKQTIASFRQISRQEAGAIRQDYVRLYTVTRNENLPALMTRMGIPREYTETIALLNSWDPDRIPPLTPGMVIKILKEL